jgi:pyridoxine kinase
MPGRVLIVSSFVADGSVGGRVAAFALERLGFDVTLVPTVLMPYHPGKGAAQRVVPSDEAFEAFLQAAAAETPVAILTGYFASAAQVALTAEAIRTLRAARPDILYLCDPVLGDEAHLYVAEDIAAAIRDRLLPLADAATPNAFECRFLAGAPDDADIAGCAAGLPAATILVTSAPSLLRGRIGNLLVAARETLLLEHRAVADAPKGTGDLLAGVLLARRLQGRDWTEAAHLALGSVCDTVLASAAVGSPDLMLAACQDSFVSPRSPIDTRRLTAARTPRQPG